MYNDGISEHNMLVYIQNKLHKLNEDEFSYYDPCISATYNYENGVYNIHFNIGIIKKYNSIVKIPVYCLHDESISNLYKYLDIICNDINKQITGIDVYNNYIEINGIKYYPEKESE